MKAMLILLLLGTYGYLRSQEMIPTYPYNISVRVKSTSAVFDKDLFCSFRLTRSKVHKRNQYLFQKPSMLVRQVVKDERFKDRLSDLAKVAEFGPAAELLKPFDGTQVVFGESGEVISDETRRNELLGPGAEFIRSLLDTLRGQTPKALLGRIPVMNEGIKFRNDGFHGRLLLFRKPPAEMKTPWNAKDYAIVMISPKGGLFCGAIVFSGLEEEKSLIFVEAIDPERKGRSAMKIILELIEAPDRYLSPTWQNLTLATDLVEKDLLVGKETEK